MHSFINFHKKSYCSPADNCDTDREVAPLHEPTCLSYHFRHLSSSACLFAVAFKPTKYIHNTYYCTRPLLRCPRWFWNSWPVFAPAAGNRRMGSSCLRAVGYACLASKRIRAARCPAIGGVTFQNRLSDNAQHDVRTYLIYGKYKRNG